MGRTPSHTAIFTDDNTVITIKFHYKPDYTPYAPHFSDEDIDEEIEILEAYEETNDKTFVLDENDPNLEKLLREHEDKWEEIEIEEWKNQRT